VRSEKGEPIKPYVADLRHLDVKAILKPLGDQMTMAEGSAQVTVRRRFPTQEYRIVAKRDQPIVDFGGVEAAQDSTIKLEIPRRGDRLEPRSRLERSEAAVASEAPRGAANYTDGSSRVRQRRPPPCRQDW
jgi:hypothetical protein